MLEMPQQGVIKGAVLSGSISCWGRLAVGRAGGDGEMLLAGRMDRWTDSKPEGRTTSKSIG